jgi:DNA helicase II / ATP-dependent DNA helicase PcrA
MIGDVRTVVDLLEGLNQEQAEAVSAGNGPTLVVAGPGSGKTRVLTRRVAYLIQEMGVRPNQIMAVTFTNKAAREMHERITAIFGESTEGLTVGTFHSICARLLRKEIRALGYRQDYTIYDTDDQIALLKGVMNELNIDTKKNSPYGQLNKISNAKNELITPEQYVPSIPPERITADVYKLYQRALRANNAVDFDDLLMLPVLLFRQFQEVLQKYQHFYRHILVDEFQDTNTAQYVFLKLLAGERNSLFVVGDPDQSIYRFRGAVPKNVGTFQKDYPAARLIKLGQNYRSHQLILDAATAVIRHNPDHVPITLTGQRQKGQRIVFHNTMTEDTEAQYIVEQIAIYTLQGYRLRDCAVMYRMNAQSRALEEAFVRAKLPYRLVGATRFYSRKEVKDLLAYLRVIYNPDDTVNLLRIINVPPRGIGEKTVQQLEKWANGRGQSLYTALRAIMQGEPNPVSGRAEKALNDFTGLLQTWIDLQNTTPVGQLLEDVISRTRFIDYLDTGDETSEDRIANVKEFLSNAVSEGNQSLGAYLEGVALVADADVRDDSADAPTLLTLHAAKGLEFPIVFIAGLEEGTLPHNRSLDDDEQMAEERRLMYVGITRAKDVLHLIWTMRRSTYGGQGDYMMPSRFLSDIPDELHEGSALPARSGWRASMSAYQQATTWSRPSPREKLALDGLANENNESRSNSSNGSNGTPPTTRPVLGRPRVEQKYQSGMKVTHKTWGEGTVITSSVRAGVEELLVKFPNSIGPKKLTAEFVEPADED